MSKNTDLQDLFLTRARRAQEPVTMFLMNGFQMRGKITGADAFVVVLDTDGKQQIIRFFLRGCMPYSSPPSISTAMPQLVFISSAFACCSRSRALFIGNGGFCQ